MKLANTRHKDNYDYKYEGDPAADYASYKEFNDLGNQAMRKLKEMGEITDEDLQWVHDYQCTNVAGDVYSQHPPFPPFSFLEQVKVNGEKLLETEYFKDYIRQLADHDTLTFPRVVDMKNFIDTVAVVDPSFKRLNPRVDTQLDTAAILEQIGGALAPLQIFGKTVKVMNLPVCVSQEDELEAAKSSKIDKTFFDKKMLDDNEISYDPATVQDGRVPIRGLLGNLLDTDEEHRIFLAVHRNDYIKSTLEKVYAAGNYMARHPEEVGKTHFVFFLEPTRSHIPGYKAYNDAVMREAKGLREIWGDSIIVVPAGVDNHDYLGLMRHPNVLALLGTARVEGHDITLREAASARSDYPPGDPRAALALITTNGTGVSDVLKGTRENPGAFVIDSSDRNFAKMHARITDVFEKVVNLAKKREGKIEVGKIELATRYQAASAASAEYNPAYFARRVMEVANQGKRHGIG
jgi:hypothetical protein